MNIASSPISVMSRTARGPLEHGLLDPTGQATVLGGADHLARVEVGTVLADDTKERLTANDSVGLEDDDRLVVHLNRVTAEVGEEVVGPKSVCELRRKCAQRVVVWSASSRASSR